MAKDDSAQGQQPQTMDVPVGDQQKSTLRLRYDRADTHYANIAIVTSMPEELVINFGLNAMPPTPQREVNIEVSNRVVLNYASAKRLAITLGNVIQRYEAAHGVINVQQAQQAPAAQAAQAQTQATPPPKSN